MIVVFWIALGLFFLGVPYILASIVGSLLHVEDRALKVGLYFLCVWGVWQHFQLPTDRTGGGAYLAAHQVVNDGQAANPLAKHFD